jgi:tetratricopeptide (TPR) repeat protein
MNRRIAVLCLTLIIGFSVKAADSKRNQLISVIQQEIQELIRLAQVQQQRNPDTLLRLAESHLELARTLRQEENERYLQVPTEERTQLKKETFFKQSQKIYLKAQEWASLLLKKHPRYEKKALVHTLIGYNALEFDDKAKAKESFQQARQSSSPRDSLFHKNNLALGQLAMDEENYSSCYRLYQESLKSSEEQKSWTKEAFNFAYCAYKLNRYEESLDLLKLIWKRSQDNNDRYVDMSNAVTRQIGLNFAQLGLINEAKAFYQKQNINVREHFLKQAIFFVEKKKYAEAETLSKELQTLSVTAEEKKQLYFFQLQLSQAQGNANLHYATSNMLIMMLQQQDSDVNFSKQEREQLLYEWESKGNLLYRQVMDQKKNNKEIDPIIEDKQIDQAKNYYEWCSIINPKKSSDYWVFQGELLYHQKNWKGAFVTYLKSYDQQGPRSAYALENLQAMLEQDSIPKDLRDEYFVEVYERFFKKQTPNQSHKAILSKMFGSYLRRGQFAKAYQAIQTFQQQAPSETKIIEQMLAQLLESLKKKDDVSGHQKLVDLIKQGRFQVSEAFLQKTKSYSLGLSFEKMEQLQQQGKIKEAIKGYLDLFQTSDTSRMDVKKNAAYNLSVLLFRENIYGPALYFGRWALKAMQPSEVLPYESTFLTLAEYLFEVRRLQESIDLQMQLFQQLCSTSSTKKILIIQNINRLSMAIDNVTVPQQILQQSSQCGLSSSSVMDLKKDQLEWLIQKKKWNSLREELEQRQPSTPGMTPALLSAYLTLYQASSSSGQQELLLQLETKIRQLYAESIKNKEILGLEVLDKTSDFWMKDLRSLQKNWSSISFSFPEETFNQQLKQKLSLLDKMISTTKTITQIGSGRGIISSYRILMETLQDFSQLLLKQVPPNGSDSYKESFKMSMQKLAIPLRTKAMEYFQEGKTLIEKDHLLTFDNEAFLLPRPNHFPYNISIVDQLQPMERGGQP